MVKRKYLLGIPLTIVILIVVLINVDTIKTTIDYADIEIVQENIYYENAIYTDSDGDYFGAYTLSYEDDMLNSRIVENKVQLHPNSSKQIK